MLLSLLPTGGCADVSADHMLLDRFFAASRLLDRTQLSRYATVVFEPNSDGIVTYFTVVSASEAGQPTILRSAIDPRISVVVERSLLDPLAPSDTAPGTQPPAARLDPRPMSAASSVTLTTRHVIVRASVRSPAGALSQRQLEVTLMRAEAAVSPPRRGRWIVTAVADRR